MNISPRMPAGYNPNVSSSYRDKDGNIQKIDPKEVTTFAELSARPLRSEGTSRPTPNTEWTWESTEHFLKQAEQSDMTPAQNEKFMKQEVDSIFRSPAGEILVVLYKDGGLHTNSGHGLDLNAMAEMGKGLSQNECRATMRNAIVSALGSRAVASHYDSNQPAPTRNDIYQEEKAYYKV